MYRGNAAGRGHRRALRVQFHSVFLDLRTRRQLMKRRASTGAGIERACSWSEPQK
jgi:hypothetical protein